MTRAFYGMPGDPRNLAHMQDIVAQYAKDAKHDQSRVIFNNGEVSAWVDASGTAHLPPVDVSRLGPNGREQLEQRAISEMRLKIEGRRMADEETMDHVQVRIPAGGGIMTHGTAKVTLTPDEARKFYRDLNAKEDRRDFWIQAAIITASAIVGGVVYALGLAAWDAWVGK